jgi:REP element-mobilizing transposase RayT
MPRRPREEAPDAFHHVVAQGNGRARIVRNDVDRTDLLRRLAAACSTHGWRCHAYCLLDNHLHFVGETSEPNLGRGMGLLLSDYAQAFHHRHGTEGHLFHRPFYSRRIYDESHFVTSCIYVVLNSAAAGLNPHPADWVWCSYEQTAFPRPGFVSTDTLLSSFARDVGRARLAYRRAVDEAVAQARLTAGVSPLTG